MNKKKLIGIIASVVLVLALAVGGSFLILHFIEATGGNRLNVEWYDVNGTEFVITTADELYEFSELSNYYDFKDQTIKLGADIVINEGNAEDWEEKAPSRKWAPITGFGGVFDGQGHTISGIYAKGYDAAVALFNNTMSGATIQNLKVTNSYFESAGFGGVASISSNGGGNFKQIYSDAIINVVGEYSGFAGGICSKLNLQSTLEECWFDGVIHTTGRDTGGIVDDILGGRVTISHCLFSGEINSAWDFSGSRTGGIVGRISQQGATLILNDCLSTGEINAASIYYTGSVLGTTTSNTSLTTTNSYGSMGSYDVAIGRSGLSGTINSYPIELHARELIGIKAYQWTNLDFNTYWAIVEDDTPILKCFAENVPSITGLEKAFDTSWYTEGSSEYVIKDRADLYGLYMLSASNTFAGKTIKVGEDIVVNEGIAKDWAKTEPEHIWYPIMKFAGTFDGQGHSISGLYLNTAAEKAGFFKETTPTAIVKNMSLKNSYMISKSTTNAFLGSISGRGGGTFDTIYSDAIIVSHAPIVGGIFAQVNAEAKSSFTNCWFDGSITMKGEKARYVGGIVGGVVKGNTTIAHCLNTAPISQLDFKDAGMFVGGIAGYIINDKTVGTITDCLNTGKISVNYHVCVGSGVGRINQATVTITDTYATDESYTYIAEKESSYEHGKFRGIGTSSKGYKGGVAHFPEAYLKGVGGYQWSSLDFKEYWTVVTGPNDTPILKSFANKVPSLAGVKRKIDTSWYSVDKKSFVLKDLADLYGFYAVSAFDTFFEDKVKLGADIVVNTGNAADWAQKAPTNPWFTIHNFKGTFDGQGHTISGVYLKTDEKYSGLFAKTTNESTIKNLRLTNSYFENTIEEEFAAFGSVVGQMGGVLNTVYSDAIVVGKGIQIGGLVGRVNQSKTSQYKITNCWFDGKVSVANKVAKLAYVGGVAGTSVQGTLNIDNCLNTGEISYTYDQMPEGKARNGVAVGGIVGGVINGVRKDTKKGTLSVVNISDSLNAGYIHAQTSTGEEHPYSDGVRSIVGFTTAGTVKIGDTVYATSESAIGIVNFNEKRATVDNKGTVVSEFDILGEKGYTFTKLDFKIKKYWSARANKVPALRSFVTNGLELSEAWRPDTDWKGTGTEKDPYIISSVGELYGLAQCVNEGNGFANQFIKLSDDIDEININKAEYAWTPIGTTDHPFRGTFDGNGKTISGISVILDDAKEYAGFFGVIADATIKNFTLSDSKIAGTAMAMGAIVGNGDGTLENIYCDSSVLIETSSTTTVGGIFGRVQDPLQKNDQDRIANTLLIVSNCWFEGSIKQSIGQDSTTIAGGIVGFLIHGTVKVENCLFTGQIDSSKTAGSSKHLYVGGIFGKANGTSSTNYMIKESLSAGSEVKATVNGCNKYVGAITSQAQGNETFLNVYATTECAPQAIGTGTNTSNKITVLGKENFVGVKGYQMTMLDFEEYWSARENKVPALKTFVGDGMTIPADTWRFDTSWYSEDKTKFDIQTEGEFYGFASLVNSGENFRGKTVTLKKDMVIVDSEWEPIGMSAENSFQGIFDGNGKTISGIHVTLNDSKNYIGLFGWIADATIKNFTLSDSTFTGTAMAMGAIVGNGDGTLSNIYCDSSVLIETSATTTVGGIFGRVQDPLQTTNADRIENTLLTVSNCWFDGSIKQTISANSTTIAGGVVGFLIHGTVNIENCLFTGNMDCKKTASGNKHLYVGGIFGKANGTSSTNYTIENSLSAGSEIKATVNGCNKYVGAIAGQAQGNETFLNVYATSECASVAAGELKGGATQPTTPVSASTLYGDLAKDSTVLDFTTYWVTRTGKVPALKFFAERSAIANDAMWLYVSAGNESDPYMLSNESEFTKFATLVNANGYSFKGKNLKLANNITVTASKWQPIGIEANPFQGTFDGNSKTISGIKVTADYKYKGLFGWTADATIQNFTLTNSTFSGKGTAIAAIIGNGDGTVSNIYCDSTVRIETTKITIVGGIVGRVQDPLQANDADRIANTLLTVTNCWFDGSIDHTISANSTTIAGGVVGFLIHGTVNIENCLFTGNMDCKKTASGNKHLYVGGIFGKANGTSTTDYTIQNSLSAGSEIKATVNGCDKYVGAIAGQAQGNETFLNVYATSECASLAVGELKGGAIQPTTPVSASTLYGNLGEDNTELDFTTYWITRTEKVPALRYFVKE